jgi:CBS domain-containing protein
MTRHPLYRLPKSIASDARAELLVRTLANAAHRIWQGSPVCAPEASLSDALLEALRTAHRAGRMVRSLEKAQMVLKSEAHGQRLADRRLGATRGRRISRLLVVTNDGAERFYRQTASLLERHCPRLVAVRLMVDAETLGKVLFGKGRAARLLMIDHKEAVGAVLLALADQWAGLA